MSRSYKKHPYCTDGRSPTPRQMKSIANRSVRRRENRIVKGWLEEDDSYEDSFMLDNRLYKKWFCSWDIHDYINRWSFAEAMHEYTHPRWFYHSVNDSWWSAWDDYTEKQFINYWAKYYRRK